MDIDLPAILLWVVFVLGVIWVIDKLIFEKSRLAQNTKAQDPKLVEYSKAFFPVLLLVLVIRSFIGEPYQIPSESMVPTLKVGDFIWVNKYAYGLRVPYFGTKILDMGDPERGDVMVFVPPHDPRFFVKRVIGIPGDEIRYENKALYVNGARLKYKFVQESENAFSRVVIREYREAIKEKDYSILRMNIMDGSRSWSLSEGQYLMLGDNRDNSQDSRVWGPAREEKIVGKAVAVWMHKDPGFELPTFMHNRFIE